MKGQGRRYVVAVKSVSGTGGLEWWSNDKLLPGDILEQLRVVNHIVLLVNAPFAGGKAGLQNELRKIYNADKRVILKVRRGRDNVPGVNITELHACVVAEEAVMRKKHYSLADIQDKSRIVVLMDAAEEECFCLQDETLKVLEEARRSHAANARLKDCLVPYTWQQKMQAFLPCPNSAMVFSLLLMPFQPNRALTEFHDLEESSARAMAWLSSAQTSGVPITFVNIQIEPILMQGSGSSYFGSSSREGSASVVNAGKYTIQDWQGTDIHIVRAVRLWFAPAATELVINLKPAVGETRLGVGLSRTEEGFCYVSSVDDQTPAYRAGLKQLYEAACAAQKLLVISRVTAEKITPWMVDSSGLIWCFDTVSISEKLSAQRQSQKPIQFHLMLWDGAFDWKGWKSEENFNFRNGTKDESAAVASREYKQSNSTIRSSSPRKSEQHHASRDNGSSKQSESPTYSDPHDHRIDSGIAGNSCGALTFSSQPQDQTIESMPIDMSPIQARESDSHSRNHVSAITAQDGVDKPSINGQIQSRESERASPFNRAVSTHELPVAEVSSAGEENTEFSFSF